MKERRFVSLRLTPPGSRRRCHKEYEYGLIETQDILIVQAPDKRTDLDIRMVVTSSTIRRQGARNPLRSFGSTASSPRR